MLNKTIQIADTIHGSIKLTNIEKEILSTQIFNRLHNISQNSTVYLTFPTNRTKRFEHSVGTMYLCGNIFYNSIVNADNETLNSFFSEVEAIIDSEINKILSQSGDKYRSSIGDKNLSPKRISEYKKSDIWNNYNIFVPINVDNKYRYLYALLFQAVRLSALLHDVGHPPFSHITENALKNIWNNVNSIDEDKRNSREKSYIEAMSRYFSNNKQLHEQIGNIITDKVMCSIIGNIPCDKQNDNEVFQYQLFKVILKELTSAILEEKSSIFHDIHKIIDGALDGDRLDYVSRDPLNSGLDSGKIEYDRLICTMRLIKHENDYLFCPSTKVLDTIEDFFNRRWRMYKQIIFHHRVVKTDYLLQSCIEELAIDYLSKEEEEKIEEDDNILPYDISGLWKAVKNTPSHQGFFDNLIQWDDGWLMTVLKKHYFIDYNNKTECPIFYKLEELLANRKNYFSLIKRMDDFVKIDSAVAKKINEHFDKIKMNIQEVAANSSNEKEEYKTIDIDPFLNEISSLCKVTETYTKTLSPIPVDGFILAKIKNKINHFFKDSWLHEIVVGSVDEVVKEYSTSNIKDYILEFKKPKTGVTESLALYYKGDKNIIVEKFSNLSKEGKSLLYDMDFLPTFYLYLLNGENKNYDTLKAKVGEFIGEKIVSSIFDKLNTLK